MSITAAPISLEYALDSLAAHVAVIARDGTIVWVNRSWRSFAAENGGTAPCLQVGGNYFSTCSRVTGEDSVKAKEAMEGLAAVIAGTRDHFTFQYRCDSPSERRWFLMMVSPAETELGRGAVVMHVNVTWPPEASDALSEANKERRSSERDQMERMRSPVSGATARAFGSLPLRETRPDAEEALVARYSELVKQSLEERIFRTGVSMTDDIRAIVWQIGAFGGGPRDVVDVHCEALRRLTLDIPAAKANAYQDEARLLLLEVMGHLVSYYRQTRLVPMAGGAPELKHAG